jgi:hypothetical protein
MGFRYYALVHHDDLRIARPDRIDLKDYPAAITDRLFGQKRFRGDPIFRGCLYADKAFAPRRCGQTRNPSTRNSGSGGVSVSHRAESGG